MKVFEVTQTIIHAFESLKANVVSLICEISYFHALKKGIQ